MTAPFSALTITQKGVGVGVRVAVNVRVGVLVRVGVGVGVPVGSTGLGVGVDEGSGLDICVAVLVGIGKMAAWSVMNCTPQRLAINITVAAAISNRNINQLTARRGCSPNIIKTNAAISAAIVKREKGKISVVSHNCLVPVIRLKPAAVTGRKIW